MGLPRAIIIYPKKYIIISFATATYHWLIFLKDIGLIKRNLSALLGLSLPPPFNLGYQFELAGVGEDGIWTNGQIKKKNNNKKIKRNGGAENSEKKRGESLRVNAAKCAKLTDMFVTTSSAAAARAGRRRR